MKRVFTLCTITAVAVASLAVVAASSLDPVDATTFPSLRVIYTANGVSDFDDTPPFGTTVICANHSGQNATVRVVFVDNNGTNKGARQEIVANGRILGVGTANGTSSHPDNFQVPTASSFYGRTVVYSTQSAVFCNVIHARSDQDDPGTSLHMVRFNPHPGAVE